MKSSEAVILAVMNATLAISWRSLKISGPQRGLTRDLAMPVRHSNQLSYEATAVGLGASHLWVHMFPWWMNQQWNDIWNESYWTVDMNGKTQQSVISYPQFNDSFYTSFHRWFIHHGNIWTHKYDKWLAPYISGFIAQLVKASHRHREVTGSNSV